jgi:predicted Zn-dependent peptidase
MKKIHSFTESLTKVKHTTYELENGVKLFHAIYPSSIEYVLTVIIRAGSSFENMNNVPYGTAHFLEHILAGNPNRYFKSKFDIDKFESGTKQDPEIFSNASTSKKYMYFYSYGNEKGSERINKRVISMLDYPPENIDKYIEKERNIILAEQSHDNKSEYDKYLQYSKFLYEGEENGFTHNEIGEPKDIKSITSENIKSFFKNQFKTENVLITVQSGKKLSKKDIKQIEELSKIFKSDGKKKYPKENLNSNKRIYHFKDNQVEGVSLSLLFPLDVDKNIDYHQRVLEHLSGSLIRKLSHDYLREKLGLIYSSYVSSNLELGFNRRILGYEVIMRPSNYSELLKNLYKMIEIEMYKFLDRKEGRVWFESTVSNFIFPRNNPYRSNYAQRKALPILDNGEVMELDKAVKEVLKINIDDVKKYQKKFFSNSILFWIESDTDGKVLVDELKRSKLYNRF